MNTPFSIITHGSRIFDARGLVGCYSIKLPELPSEPVVSVIIPIYNQLDYTLRCLSSISKYPQKTSFEVIIVDDCSELGVYHALNEIPNLRIIRNFKNQGFVRSCNRGAHHAKGQYVLMLNNDTEATEDWMDALVRTFETRPDAGLVGSKLIYPDGKLQEAGGIIWQDGSGWNYGRNDDSTLPWYNYLRETDYCSGASIMLRKTIWDKLKGFDLHYVPAYYEDTDLAFRVRAAGLKVYYQPHSCVIHHEGKSNGTDLGSGLKQYQVVNRVKFIERWRGELNKHYPNAEQVFRARDRSYHQKTILFIDHFIPHFDQDAGARNIFSYMQVFLDAGFNVKLIGDNFHPHQPYQTFFENLGVEVLTGSYMRGNWEHWLELNGAYLDYVLFSRANTCERWVEPVKRLSKARCLFYGHDLISRTFLRAYKDFGDETMLLQSKQWREKEDYLIRSSHATFYPSEVEVQELRERFPDKIIEALPLFFMEPRDRDRDLNIHERSGVIFVGSFGHPPNLDAVKWILTEIMPAVRATLGPITCNFVGRNPPKDLVALATENDIFHGYVSDDRLRELYNNNRIALAPLRVGGGIKGKILEAFYQGIPVVTTKIGIEGIPTSGEDCVVVEENAKYAEKLIAVYPDCALLTKLAENAYQNVLKYCSKNNIIRHFDKAVDGALTNAVSKK